MEISKQHAPQSLQNILFLLNSGETGTKTDALTGYDWFNCGIYYGTPEGIRAICSWQIVRCCRHRAGGKQQSTGLLHFRSSRPNLT